MMKWSCSAVCICPIHFYSMVPIDTSGTVVLSFFATDNFIYANRYTLTALSSLMVVKKVLEGNFKPGYQTPAARYGEELRIYNRGNNKRLNNPAVTI